MPRRGALGVLTFEAGCKSPDVLSRQMNNHNQLALQLSMPEPWVSGPTALQLGRIRCTCYNQAMIAADIFRPEQWNNFFLLVGTGAVTLTGLVFVAMSLNLKVVAVDATHRYRAINTLTGLALVFMRCALVDVYKRQFCMV